MKEYGQMIVTDELKEKYKDDPEFLREIEYRLKWHWEKMSAIYVIYNPDCGCPIDQFVILDRYPMTKKIFSICPECKKSCFMEISNPIVFHDPIREADFMLKDLKDMIINDSPQKKYLIAYQNRSPLYWIPLVFGQE